MGYIRYFNGFYLTIHFGSGVVHEDLKSFLQSNVPTGKKKTKVQLGISDPKIGPSIQESCNIQCESGAAVLEITRGIRFHFHKLIQGNFCQFNQFCFVVISLIIHKI